MGYIWTRHQIALMMKSNRILSQRGSKGYYSASDLLGSYPKKLYPEAGTILCVSCEDDLIIDNKILDLSNNEQDGVITGAILSSESKFRESLLFNGSSDYIDFSNPSIFDLTSQITLEVWIRLNSTSGTQTFIGKGTDTWVLRLNSLGDWEIYMNGGDVKTKSPTGVNTTAWHYIVATFDGTDVKLYCDGEEIANQNAPDTIDTNTTNVRIGATATPSEYLNGYCAGARISNRAKIANEIHDYYWGLMGL